MRLSARIGVVLAIAAVATVAAIPFRKSAAPLPPESRSAKLPIERRLNTVGESWNDRFQTAPLQAEPLRALSVSGDGNASSVPDLPEKYHRILSPVGALLNSSELPPDEEPQLLDTGAPARALTHKIVDGDTLSRLAEHYWGDALLAGKIFEANRDILQSPELLPLGRVLKIPSREEALTPAAAVVEAAPKMAPIPRGAFREN
jgi:nucleoid-associated protein YgaU